MAPPPHHVGSSQPSGCPKRSALAQRRRSRLIQCTLNSAFGLSCLLLEIVTAPQDAEAKVKALASTLFQVVQLCEKVDRISQIPFPCLEVTSGDGPSGGFAVVPYLDAAAVLLVPTQRLSGIDSPDLLSAEQPNWWQYAWDARRFLIERRSADIPRDRVALAINSKQARMQDQLHIHVACVNSSFKAEIQRFEAAVTSHWSRFPLSLASQRWWSMRVHGSDLEANPFVLLSRLAKVSRSTMGDWGIATLAWNFTDGTDGFLIFATRRDKTSFHGGSASALLDPRCEGGS